jgi:hypothetical protein
MYIHAHAYCTQQAAAAGVEVTRSREDFIFQSSAYKPVTSPEASPPQLQQQRDAAARAQVKSAVPFAGYAIPRRAPPLGAIYSAVSGLRSMHVARHGPWMSVDASGRRRDGPRDSALRSRWVHEHLFPMLPMWKKKTMKYTACSCHARTHRCQHA